jgi:hypothetical protein
MIRLRVEDVCGGGLKVSVNLPVSFFHAVLDALPDDLDDRILQELGRELDYDFGSGDLDLERLLDSLDELKAETPFEMKDNCSRVRLWVE